MAVSYGLLVCWFTLCWFISYAVRFLLAYGSIKTLASGPEKKMKNALMFLVSGGSKQNEKGGPGVQVVGPGSGVLLRSFWLFRHHNTWVGPLKVEAPKTEVRQTHRNRNRCDCVEEKIGKKQQLNRLNPHVPIALILPKPTVFNATGDGGVDSGVFCRATRAWLRRRWLGTFGSGSK